MRNSTTTPPYEAPVVPPPVAASLNAEGVEPVPPPITSPAVAPPAVAPPPIAATSIPANPRFPIQPPVAAPPISDDASAMSTHGDERSEPCLDATYDAARTERGLIQTLLRGRVRDGLIALSFLSLGVWLGRTHLPQRPVVASVADPFMDVVVSQSTDEQITELQSNDSDIAPTPMVGAVGAVGAADSAPDNVVPTTPSDPHDDVAATRNAAESSSVAPAPKMEVQAPNVAQSVSPASVSSARDSERQSIESQPAPMKAGSPIRMTPVSLTSLEQKKAPISLKAPLTAMPPQCDRPEMELLGTMLEWADSPTDAARLAVDEDKLVFLIHVSGNFEIPGFT